MTLEEKLLTVPCYHCDAQLGEPCLGLRQGYPAHFSRAEALDHELWEESSDGGMEMWDAFRRKYTSIESQAFLSITL